jgi:hypothetical protein
MGLWEHFREQCSRDKCCTLIGDDTQAILLTKGGFYQQTATGFQSERIWRQKHKIEHPPRAAQNSEF